MERRRLGVILVLVLACCAADAVVVSGEIVIVPREPPDGPRLAPTRYLGDAAQAFEWLGRSIAGFGCLECHDHPVEFRSL